MNKIPYKVLSWNKLIINTYNAIIIENRQSVKIFIYLFQKPDWEILFCPPTIPDYYAFSWKTIYVSNKDKFSWKCQFPCWKPQDSLKHQINILNNQKWW